MSEAGARGPYVGVRVIDCSRAVAGPYCAMMLGDLGADVIKVEVPQEGDESRRYAPSYGDDSCYFLATNRNKRGITLDLKSPDAPAILERLLRDADVFLDNFRPQALARLGLSHEALRKRHPGLIHCSITGFGPKGPMAERPAMDALIQAYTGLMSLTGEPQGPPVRAGIAVADLGTALFALSGIQAALAHKARTGEGQVVETSLMESMLALTAYQQAVYWGTGRAPMREGSSHPAMAPLQVFRVADGYLLVMAANQKQWLALCDAIEAPALKEDARFATNESRVSNKVPLHAALDAILIHRTRAEWDRRFGEFDVMRAPINDVGEALREPQALQRGMLVERPHPKLGTMRYTGFPVKLSATPAAFRRDPPAVGQHTDEVLGGLGFDAKAIAAFRAAGSI